jgi:hypothetical protein
VLGLSHYKRPAGKEKLLEIKKKRQPERRRGGGEARTKYKKKGTGEKTKKCIKKLFLGRKKEERKKAGKSD